MTTLVTGATGFLGSAVVRALLERGESVRVLTRPNNNRRNIHGLDVELVEGNLNDPDSLRRAVRGCRALYHTAADYRLWAREPAQIYETNVTATRQLLRLASDAGVGRVVYTSSVATLGREPSGRPADEQTPVTIHDMTGHYKRSKYMAEEEVKRLVREEDVPAVIVNPSTIIGPRDIRPTPTGRMVEEAVRGKIPAFVDTGLNVVHVEDVAAGHVQAFERGEVGERYVLGGEDMMLREILEHIASLTGRRPPRVRLPRGAVLPVAYLAEFAARVRRTGREPLITVDGLKMSKTFMFFSSEKAKQALGYAPRPAREALADAVEWLRAHKL
ncbi:MAG: NAD-dependent epimerase/dehydratase family protein [Gammaproteobacteria bacterium]|nr:NAD-dependent epimerase/dehydratase family protein [Gammaproteobacteria bacterium]NIM73165.1 NAD-dependent epimerase/dehydratase family protein [Gammaproteobacteria bacterium]NIN38845.1 NAD-dependent epimerase/dehydratase family protein [Gammaproteobacteria bacterium]NIO24920.1 NAD-dependent epimerase/dehydratase family protein [Gammaproteobacteria bacterium]NIO65522.1 NAD-dependent epimerase/dehydratase family protein [Gammaproteobacteria bacterium]